MKTEAKIFLFAVCLGFAGLLGGAEKRYEPNWSSLDTRAIPGWYDEAKFGIFIHWGVYSVPAWGKRHTYAEWYWFHLNRPFSATSRHHDKTYGKDFKYEQFAPRFQAENFQPEQWAELFRNSGAKYVVLTSKHHEGYCLYPTQYSPGWNSMEVGAHRDLLGDLSKAVRAQGLKMGYYYSLYEWYNPLYRSDVNKYVDTHMLPQIKELVTNYQPALIFADGEWDHPSGVWRSAEFLAWLYNDSAVKDEVVVDDRWGMETRGRHGDYYTSEYGKTTAGKKVKMDRKWEENQGIGWSFGYNANEPDQDYKTAEQLIKMLVEIVSKGGNLLLDVGPTADGRIPQIMQDRLLAMGEWLGVNGEAIYGTSPWRVSEEGNVRYTQKGNAVYAIALSWPGKELSLIAPVAGEDTAVSMLGYKENLKFRSEPGKLIIETPKVSLDQFPAKYAYVFKLSKVK